MQAWLSLEVRKNGSWLSSGRGFRRRGERVRWNAVIWYLSPLYVLWVVITTGLHLLLNISYF